MAPLKISDLSVGDWVINHRGYQTKVQVLTSDGNLLCGELDAKSEHCAHLWVQDIKPIPITAEILEKIGWRIIEKEALGEDYEYDGDERVCDNDNNKIDICEQKQGEFWHSYRSEYYLYRLYYVHQLQHLMRLYGVEEEIKFKVNLISTT